MPYGRTSTTATALLVIGAIMLPAGVMLAASDDQLVAAKDEFNMLWHSAAETTKKRSTLEQTLASFDTKVATARRDLVHATMQRKEVRAQMAEHEKLLLALRGQIAAAQDAEAFYQAVALSQKDDFADFVRFMVSRDIAERESGPAAASPLVKQILKGSLGETIDEQMARSAVSMARQRFFDQLRVLLLESHRIESQLHAATDEMASELADLEQQHVALSAILDKTSAFIDNSWRERTLTEAELAEVAAEAAESSARIAEMQSSLLKINEELKATKLKALQDDLARAQAAQKDVEERRENLKRKDQALAMLEENALHAFQAAKEAKGTDKKLYKRIEEAQLHRSNALDELRTAKAKVTGTGASASSQEVDRLSAVVARDDALIALMKEGVPGDEAEAYLDARRQADEAAPVRKQLAVQIKALNAEVATAMQAVSLKVGQIDTVSKQFELSDLPPIFVWPVSGSVTAGYFDPAYETVFHVPHRAVDIAVPQSTPVHAISDGVVFAVKDGGLKGFSYILIGHRNGYASLYGHVSASFVSKGDIVATGQVIGLSGGMPGTHGAGPMTTGAHVHIEITQNGVHVNPLNVLPTR